MYDIRLEDSSSWCEIQIPCIKTNAHFVYMFRLGIDVVGLTSILLRESDTMNLYTFFVYLHRNPSCFGTVGGLWVYIECNISPEPVFHWSRLGNMAERSGCGICRGQFLPEESFQSWGSYVNALKQTWSRLRERAFTRFLISFKCIFFNAL